MFKYLFPPCVESAVQFEKKWLDPKVRAELHPLFKFLWRGKHLLLYVEWDNSAGNRCILTISATKMLRK